MVKEITAKIESVELKKSGETNGKKWKKFEVIAGGNIFSTFDEGYMNYIGQTIKLVYSEEDREYKGKPYTSKTLLNLSKINNENNAKPSQSFSQTKNEMSMHEKVDEIYRDIKLLLRANGIEEKNNRIDMDNLEDVSNELLSQL